ncbi:hypothetical protein FAZ69_15770 [Trinickia terrae]|uniref:Uncharacterized protein n=1 Tax=Trinickia terrae TaxID=2571161 RepID=A0A4U1I3G8_9BURK|nr:hypothetical protein [Trinickia terrae]TKC87742.1 hypothetical protein FAZ69_15770 [Trinickia terrae]
MKTRDNEHAGRTDVGTLAGLTIGVAGAPVLITALTLPIVAALPLLSSVPLLVPLLYAVAVLMGAVVSLTSMFGVWRRSRDAQLIAAGVGVCALLGVSDWMLRYNVISLEGWFLGAYTNAAMFGMFGILMYQRHVNAIEEVEQRNASLAQRLKAREAELELSRQQPREAERRQAIGDEH